MMTPLRPTLLALLTVGFMSGNALAMTKAEHQSAQDQIATQYKSDKAQCDSLKGNAKDVCVKEAKGKESVAKANLEAEYKPTESTRMKAREAKAEADYDVAKEKCDDQSGNAKDVCKKDAKAAYVTAKENAKVSQAAETPNANSTQKSANVAETRKEATEEKNEANYDAAKERCDAMSGAAKDKCVADAKLKFGQK
ncbi:MAG: hypothetical protein JSS17_16805 [Proteobacteria bacterium]|nr:hypothetical protein [Pseudomonadota bacterium]